MLPVCDVLQTCLVLACISSATLRLGLALLRRHITRRSLAGALSTQEWDDQLRWQVVSCDGVEVPLRPGGFSMPVAYADRSGHTGRASNRGESGGAG